MKPVFLTLFVAVLVALASTTLARGDRICMNSSELEAALTDWYDEALVSHVEDGTSMWASVKNGTWTRVSYHEDGTSCVLAQGINWTSDHNNQQILAGMDQGRG